MSVWEAAQKQAAGRLHLRGTVEEWLAESVSDDGLQLIDLEVRDLIASTRLPGGIHGDPTDRILAATAREHNFTLVTHDTELRRYAKQGHLKVHKV